MVQEPLRWGALLLAVCWSFAGFALGLKLIQDYCQDRWLPGETKETPNQKGG